MNLKKIVEKFNNTKIKYFRNPIKENLYKARNKAIKASSGDLIAFLDCDDWWEKNSYMYDDYDEPYIIYKPQIQKSLPDSKHDYCLKCDCILRYDEGNICCSCEELKEK